MALGVAEAIGYGGSARARSSGNRTRPPNPYIAVRNPDSPTMKLPRLLLIPALSLLLASSGLAGEAVTPETLPEGQHMYVIERVIPGAGAFSAEKLKSISETSCGVLSKMGPKIQWLHSYVTGDKIYCVYVASNEAMVREHAKLGGFPANSVSEVTTIISPETAK
jgi:hypothetical protein